MVAVDVDNLPADFDAEQKLIGCLLVDSRRWYSISNQIQSSDFVDKTHAAVFEAIAELSASCALDLQPRAGRAPIDIKPVSDKLKSSHVDVDLASYRDAICTGWDYRYYAKRIAELSIRRKVVLASLEAARYATDGSNIAADIVDRAMIKIGSSAPAVGSSVTTISDVLTNDVLPRMERDVYGKDDCGIDAGITTGFNSIDYILGPMRRGSLITLAGRPSHGKTSLACNIACEVAFNQKRRVLFVSLEQPQREIAEAIVRSAARVGPIMPEMPMSEKRESLQAVLGVLPYLTEADTFSLVEGSRVSVEWIDGVCRLQKAINGLDFVVIDYLGLIKRPTKIQLATYQIEYITNRLKSMAKELDVPIMMLCQLGRSFESERNQKSKGESSKSEPGLHHLRDSGSIEQDSDVVMFVWRNGDVLSGDTPVKFKVGKNRHGKTGTVDLNFTGSYKRFSEPVEEAERHAIFDQHNQQGDYDSEGFI